MIEDLPDILHWLIGQKDHLQMRFPGPDVSVPAPAFNVPLPRLEIMLGGQLGEQGLPLAASTLTTLQALYAQAGKRTLPRWTGLATTLSILFGRQKLEFNIQCWNGKNLYAEKQSVSRLGPYVGSYLLLNLNEVGLQPDLLTARPAVVVLLGHRREQLVGLEMRVSRSRDLFLAVQGYFEESLSLPPTRESATKRFHIAPNYLSRIFQKSGLVGSNEYLTRIRLEKAKRLLYDYDLKVKETAHNCGFINSNYFCRIFKCYTERSSSEHRRHCHNAQQT